MCQDALGFDPFEWPLRAIAGNWAVEAISDPANDLVDAVLLAVAEIFAGTASFETGIGPIIGYSAAAIQIGYIITL
jgi:hypothetical protein